MIPRGLNPWHILTLTVLMLSILLTTYNVHHLHILQKQHLSVLHPESADCTLGGGPTYSVFAKVKQNKRRNSQKSQIRFSLLDNNSNIILVRMKTQDTSNTYLQL